MKTNVNEIKKESQKKISGDILVMCLADPSGNPRPRRVIKLCCDMGYSVSVASYSMSNPVRKIENHYLINKKENFFHRKIELFRDCLLIALRLILRTNEARDYINDIRFRLNKLPNQIKDTSFDLIIVENLELLPLAYRIKNNAKILFDAREYYPSQREDSMLFRLLERPERIRLCQEYLHRCDSLITVSNGLANEYMRVFNTQMKVIRSVPHKSDCHVKKVDIEKIKIVHHGAARKNRKIENMIEVMDKIDERFHLDLYLTGDKKYIKKLMSISKNNPRIRFCEPVPLMSIVSMLNNYDIGFYFLEPTNFNTKHCLPNKLFEFIQARLMVVIGPSPDMAELVNKYNCGVVSSAFDIEEISNILQNITYELIMEMKRNSDMAAKELCFEKEAKKLENIISGLIYKNYTNKFVNE